VVAGLALFLAALDAVEPIAQEIDHPTRRRSLPEEEGAIELRHIPVAGVTMLFVAIVGAAAAVLVAPSVDALKVAAVCVVPAALGAVAGALVSVIAGAPSQGDSWSLLPPEVAGMRLAYRTAWPPALAVLGVVPVIVARTVARHDVDPVTGALAAGVGVLVLFVLVCGWVRVRESIHIWWRTQMDAAMPSSRPSAATEEDTDG
jgi:hypothetical protein